MSGIKVKGLTELRVAVQAKGSLSRVKQIVQLNGDELNRRMKAKTTGAFKKGYTTGATASSINTVISDGGMTASVGPTMNYDPYVEYGTRFMEAEPFVRPAFEEQAIQFEKDMKELTS